VFAVEPDGLGLFAQRAERRSPTCWSSIRMFWVMTDDMYEHLVYDDFVFTTPAQIEPKLYDPHLDGERRLQGLLHDGLAHRLCRRSGRADQGGWGWRPFSRKSTSNPSSIAQWASVEALNGPQDFIPVNNKVFKERRDLVVSMLNQAKGIECPRPEGAFYVYPSCAGNHRQGSRHQAKTIANDEDFVTELLEKRRASRSCRGRRSGSGRRSASRTPPKPPIWRTPASVSSASAVI